MAVESDVATNALSFMMTPSMKANRFAFVQAVETVEETLNLSQGYKVSIF